MVGPFYTNTIARVKIKFELLQTKSIIYFIKTVERLKIKEQVVLLKEMLHLTKSGYKLNLFLSREHHAVQGKRWDACLHYPNSPRFGVGVCCFSGVVANVRDYDIVVNEFHSLTPLFLSP